MDKAREMVSQAAGHSVVASVALNGVVVARKAELRTCREDCPASRSPLFLFQGKQKKDDAERCRNRGGSEARARDFNARMKTFF